MAMVNTYRIAAVARRTGLTADTIRAWERRYGMVTPLRTASGERRYTDSDIARLELARAAVTLGHAVRHVAALSDAQIKALVDAAPWSSNTSDLEEPAARRTIGAILQAIQTYNLDKAESLLNSAAIFFAPYELIVDVLAPLMQEVGDGWESGRITIAQEHFTSHLVRSVIGSLLRVRQPAGDETLLFLTPSNELHELGILFAAALAAAKGMRAIVLGASVPSKQVAAAARVIGPSRVVVGITNAEDVEASAAYVAELRQALPSSTSIYLGGQAGTKLPITASEGRLEVVATLADFYRSLGGARV